MTNQDNRFSNFSIENLNALDKHQIRDTYKNQLALSAIREPTNFGTDSKDDFIQAIFPASKRNTVDSNAKFVVDALAFSGISRQQSRNSPMSPLSPTRP